MAADSDSKPTTSIKRFRIGLNVLVQVALLVFIVGVVNMLGCRKYVQWDYTATRRFSLDDQTRRILNNLPHDLYLTVAFSRSSDVYRYTWRMIQLYEKEARGKLKVRWVDPVRDPGAIADLKLQDENLTFDQNKVLISKTEKLEIAGSNGPEVAPYEVVTSQEMFHRAENLMFRDGKAKRGNVTEYRLERALTSAILAATQDRQQVVYVITGKGRMRTVQGKNAGGVLRWEGGRRQNLRLEPLPFTPNTTIPQDASAVMMISPSMDFSGGELREIFHEYWEKRKGGLILLLSPLHKAYDKLPNLRGHLETYYGVRWENDRVLSLKNQGGRNLKVFEVPGWFHEDSPITKALFGRHLTFPEQSSSLNIRVEGDANDPLAPVATDKKSLIAADYYSDGYWKERDYKEPNPTAERRETHDINLAVSVEKGAGINQDLRLNSSRMVVASNGNFVDPDHRTPEGVEFVLSSINWVSARDDLVSGIGVERVAQYRVDVGERPYAKMERMALRTLPGAVFLTGLVVAFFRRR